MQTVTRCLTDLIRLSKRSSGKITDKAIGEYFAEWRALENGSLYQRQSKLTDAEHQRRVDAYHAGGSDLDMAARVGISAPAYAEWRRRNGLQPKGIRGIRKGRKVGTNYGEAM